MTIEYKDSKRIITSPNSASYWDFDGTNDYVQMPTIPTGYTFAVSMWVRKDASGRMAFMVDNDTNGIWLEDADAGSTRLRVGHSQSGSDFDTSTGFPVDSNFHHLVFNVGTPNQIWLDGVSLGTGGSANSTSTNWIPAMGARNSSGTIDRFLNGGISKVGIWDRKLTDAEVSSLYAEADPSTISSGLLATYNFEQTGNTLEDQTNSYDGTNNGATTGGTRDVPETKPTDVQDNSIIVEKDTVRRYWFSQELAPTYTGDMDSSGWNDSNKGSTISLDTTNNEVDFLNTTGNNSVAFDTTSIETLSTSSWVVRFKLRLSGTQSGDWGVFWYVMSSVRDLTANSTITDCAGFSTQRDPSSSNINPNLSMGNDDKLTSTEVQSRLQLSGSNIQITKDTDYYVEIKRDGSNFTDTVYSDSTFETVVGTKTNAITGSGLRYLVFANYNQGSGSTATVSDLLWYNETTSVTPATWTMEPTYDTNFTSTSGWLTDGTDINIDTGVNAIISDNNNGSTTHQGISKDLGSDLHATKWVIDLDIYCTNITNSNSNWTHIGMSNYNASRDDDEAQNFMGINVIAEYTQSATGNGNFLGLMSNSNTTLGNFTPVGVSGDGDEVATGTQFYLRLIRDGATTLKLERHPTSARTGSTLTTTHSCNNLSGLRYFVISHYTFCCV